MDMLRGLKTMTLPWSTKALVVALLATSLAVNVALFFLGLSKNEADVLSATIEFFGVLLPILLVTLVLAKADTGVAALARRTELFFTRTLPTILSHVSDGKPEPYLPNPRQRPPKVSSQGAVLVDINRNGCASDLVIYCPDGPGRWKAVPLRLELNVRRVNLSLCFPDAVLKTKAKTATLAGQELTGVFRHTLAGASADQPGRPASCPSYRFLDTPIVHTIGGIPFRGLVGCCFLSESFLWDSAEQLYFAQDLLFMIRALLSEAPDYFVTVASPKCPATFDAFRAALGQPQGDREKAVVPGIPEA